MEFIKLPSSFIASLLKYWLSNHDLIKLDLSTTDIRYKKVYELPFFKIERRWDFVNTNISTSLNWIIKNKIRLTNLYIRIYSYQIGFYISENPITTLKFHHLINDNNFRSLIQINSRIHTIDLSYCKKITNNSLIEISKNCPNLTVLDISGCYEITNRSLLRIFKKCCLLQKVILVNTKFKNNIFSSLRECKNLTYLDISQSFNLDIQDKLDAMINLKNIETFILGGFLLLNHKMCMKIIESTGCENRFKSIEIVEFKINHIDDKLLIKIYERLSNVVSTNISNLNLSSNTIIKISEICKNLNHFVFNTCGSSTYDTITTIIKNIPNLNSLIIKNLEISDIMHIVSKCENSVNVTIKFYNSIVLYNFFDEPTVVKIRKLTISEINIFYYKDGKIFYLCE